MPGFREVTEIRAINGTMNIIGLHVLKTGALSYFIKPNPGSRAIDCLGTNGPTPN